MAFVEDAPATKLHVAFACRVEKSHGNPTGHLDTVLYVDLAGNATPLWQVKAFQAAWAIPPHNGKYVAIPAPTTECNVWMVENF
jgi:hypothetical protein